MSKTTGRVDRAGTITFGDACLSIYEEGISVARADGGHKGVKAWEIQFKRDVFARIVQTLNRLGWDCSMPEISEHDVKHYGGNVARWSAESKRICRKGDLKADLEISGRCISFKMFQSVNCPTRPDNEGRYESNKRACMPYLIRLEMERTRRRIRDYLLNVLSSYEFKSPNPVLGVSGVTALEFAAHRRSTTGHYVPALDRARIGNKEQGLSADGVAMENGSKVYAIDSAGRVICGAAFYDLNGNWQIVTGRYDMKCVWHTEIYANCPGDPRVKRNARQRRQRLEGELAKSIKAMNFERAAVLRDILFPNNPALFAIWNSDHKVYHRPGCRGYTSDLSEAGKFTADEVRGWDCAPNKVVALDAQAVTA